jgi:hypothetical protein
MCKKTAMQQFVLTSDLPFTDHETNNGIVFTKFLPREDEALEVIIDGYRIKMYFSYEKRHLNHVSNDFITRPIEINGHINICTNSLRLQMHKDITQELFNLLADKSLNSETETFCRNLMCVIIKCYDYIFDYMRNILKQVWLQHFTYSSTNINSFFSYVNAVWSCKGQLRPLCLKGQSSTISVSYDTSREDSYVSKQKWNELRHFIEEKRKSKTVDIFIANSLEYLESSNTRMAILEAVIALEHYIKNESCENIKSFIPTDEFVYIKKLLLKKHQLSIPMGLILIKMGKELESSNITAEDINRSIELRNMIMHNSQKEVNHKEALNCVINIKNLIYCIRSLNQRSAHITNASS